MRNILIVLSGPSGVGKGELIKRLKEKHKRLITSVSYTTREPRAGEVDGVDYYFVSKKEFLRKMKDGDFLEYSKHFDNYYGTPRSAILERLKANDIAFEIEVDGALSIKKQFPEAVMIMVVPPTMEDLERRLLNRGSESKKLVKKRLQRCLYELDKVDEFDYVVINDTIDAAERELRSIIRKEKHIDDPTNRDYADMDDLEEQIHVVQAQAIEEGISENTPDAKVYMDALKVDVEPILEDVEEKAPTITPADIIAENALAEQNGGLTPEAVPEEAKKPNMLEEAKRAVREKIAQNKIKEAAKADKKAEQAKDKAEASEAASEKATGAKAEKEDKHARAKAAKLSAAERLEEVKRAAEEKKQKIEADRKLAAEKEAAKKAEIEEAKRKEEEERKAKEAAAKAESKDAFARFEEAKKSALARREAMRANDDAAKAEKAAQPATQTVETPVAQQAATPAQEAPAMPAEAQVAQPQAKAAQAKPVEEAPAQAAQPAEKLSALDEAKRAVEARKAAMMAERKPAQAAAPAEVQSVQTQEKPAQAKPVEEAPAQAAQPAEKLSAFEEAKREVEARKAAILAGRKSAQEAQAAPAQSQAKPIEEAPAQSAQPAEKLSAFEEAKREVEARKAAMKAEKETTEKSIEQPSQATTDRAAALEAAKKAVEERRAAMKKK